MVFQEIGIKIALPVAVGIIIGIVEAYFVYEDENNTNGKEFIADIFHGILFCVIGTLVASNIPLLLNHHLIPDYIRKILFVDKNGNSLIVSGIVTLFMISKMVIHHTVIKGIGNGFKEKFWHKLAVALAVGFAPYYIILLEPLLKPITSQFPSWLK